jgi:hypothetical protein
LDSSRILVRSAGTKNLTGVQVQIVDTVDTDLLEGTDALRADRAEEQPHAIGLLASLAGHL